MVIVVSEDTAKLTIFFISSNVESVFSREKSLKVCDLPSVPILWRRMSLASTCDESVELFLEGFSFLGSECVEVLHYGIEGCERFLTHAGFSCTHSAGKAAGSEEFGVEIAVGHDGEQDGYGDNCCGVGL